MDKDQLKSIIDQSKLIIDQSRSIELTNDSWYALEQINETLESQFRVINYNDTRTDEGYRIIHEESRMSDVYSLYHNKEKVECGWLFQCIDYLIKNNIDIPDTIEHRYNIIPIY